MHITVVFVPFSVDRYPGLLGTLAIVNNVVVIREVQISHNILISFPLSIYREMSLLDHIFNFLRNLCSVFHNGSTNLYFLKMMQGFLFLHILSRSYLSSFFLFFILCTEPRGVLSLSYILSHFYVFFVFFYNFETGSN